MAGAHFLFDNFFDWFLMLAGKGGCRVFRHWALPFSDLSCCFISSHFFSSFTRFSAAKM